jgi:hypothetical protein
MNDINTNGGNATVTAPNIVSTFQTSISAAATGTLGTTKDEINNTIPIFMLRSDATATPATTTATWKFGIGDKPGLSDDQIALFAPSIFVRGSYKTFYTGYTVPDSLDIPRKLESAVISGLASGTTLPSNGTINMILGAPQGDGVAQLAFEIPVVALTSTIVAPDDPITWYIRGGLSNGLLDAGVSPNVAESGKLGGAILLGFGNLSSFPWINLNPTWN